MICLKSEENYLCYSGIVLALSSFCLNTIFNSPTLISKPKRNLVKVCRYATYYVGRSYMRKHARILHTLLWLMHQLSQSRKRCCISTFFLSRFQPRLLQWESHFINTPLQHGGWFWNVPVAVRSRKAWAKFFSHSPSTIVFEMCLNIRVF